MTTPAASSSSPATEVRGASRSRWVQVLLVSVAAIALAHALDAWAWQHVRDSQVYDRDWGRMLRSAGYLPTWFIVAIALAAHDRGSPGWKTRGALMALVPTASGALAEVLKLLFRRLRPGTVSPDYAFRPYLEDFWSNRGMGLPSSHVMVAMGAAMVLGRLFPRSRWLWYVLAAGCAYTRVLAGAHYLSDVTLAACVAWVCGDWVMRRFAQ